MLPYTLQRNLHSSISHVETSLTGYNLLSYPKLNKGCAFTQEERIQFGLTEILPFKIETLEQQVARMYSQYQSYPSRLSKNIYLNALHATNETLFYTLVSTHLEEMLPIIYTPTVGDAVERFSVDYRRSTGLYLNYMQRNDIAAIFEHRTPREIDLIVITDGESVLGIGDQGIGGAQIANAKLMVYVLCGKINPHRVLPIHVDVGTNNPQLLADPNYLGWRHERITGQAYDDYIDTVVQAIRRKWPHIFLHWEDFGRDNARRLLARYRDQLCTFNGDMQGTAVVAFATILAGVYASGIPLIEQKIVIFGAGTAGVGIADQIYLALQSAGRLPSQARLQFWLLDKNGLLMDDTPGLLPFQSPYARQADEIKHWQLRQPGTVSLYDVINHVHPTLLIGCSTVAGAFNEEIIKTMAAHVPMPIILPLSNPTSKAEAHPEDLLRWTDGRALIATGSPFPAVTYNNQLIRIAQCNNALAFPGIGLGAIAAKAKHVSDGMLRVATETLSACSPLQHTPFAPLLPKVADLADVSQKIAAAVAHQAQVEGLSQISKQSNLTDAIQQTIWEPHYYPYNKI